MSPPEIMEDIQRMINAGARALCNNMAIASGPQVEVQVDRLPDGTRDIEQLYPWKIWQTKSGVMGGGHAIQFFQPDSHAAELQAFIDSQYRKADEVTGIPNYTYGSSQVAGAGRTASGLSMLMENASKGIRQAIANVDGALSSLIQAMYEHNMLYEPDPRSRATAAWWRRVRWVWLPGKRLPRSAPHSSRRRPIRSTSTSWAPTAARTCCARWRRVSSWMSTRSSRTRSD
jgi:hypothetical protein